VPRFSRRGFLRLALASAFARPAGAAPAAGPTALDVHRDTRNTWHGPTALGSLFTERPLPYKPYPGAPRIALPRALPAADRSLAEAVREAAPAPAFSDEPISLAALAALLQLTNGVTGEIPGSDPPEYRRAAPSAGALYAGEVYVVAERVTGLAPGAYSYAVAEHALVSIGSGAVPGEVAGAACAVLLSNVFARYAWRYRQRGYRYALIDSGHIGENLRLAAAAGGFAHASPRRFHDDALNALLGLDGTEEAVCALHGLGLAVGTREIASRAWRGASRAWRERGRAEGSLSTALRYHEATKLEPDAAGEPAPAPRAPAPPPLLPASPSLSVAAAISQRRSARGFRDEPITQDELAFVTELARSPGLSLRLVVHRVAQLAPGLYDAAPGGLALLRSGSLERRMIRACLFQERAGTAAVAFAFVADLGRARAEGERTYRDQLLEAGAAAQRVYLAAESLGLAARNLAAFFDDSLDDLLELDGREHVAIHLTLLGRESQR